MRKINSCHRHRRVIIYPYNGSVNIFRLITKMQTITLVHATPGKFAKMKVETSSVAALRGLAAEMAARPAAEVRIVWRGQILQDSFQLDTINNGLVTIGRKDNKSCDVMSNVAEPGHFGWSRFEGPAPA